MTFYVAPFRGKLVMIAPDRITAEISAIEMDTVQYNTIQKTPIKHNVYIYLWNFYSSRSRHRHQTFAKRGRGAEACVADCMANGFQRILCSV